MENLSHNLKVVGSNPTPATTENAAKLWYFNNLSAFVVSGWLAGIKAGESIGNHAEAIPRPLQTAWDLLGTRTRALGARGIRGKDGGRWRGAIRCCGRAECRSEAPVWLEGFLPHQTLRLRVANNVGPSADLDHAASVTSCSAMSPSSSRTSTPSSRMSPR